MQFKLRVRGTNPKQPHKWSVVLETKDRAELDREADRMHRRYLKGPSESSPALMLP